jgi:hypothetical protein
MEAVPAAIMVGTVEPRKGHRQVVAAFDALWQSGVDLNLVIVGKKGWMVDELATAIMAHRAFGQRLFWIQDASDAVLERVYELAHVLIAASMGEGFGLPLVEAALRGVPIVARDLGVFSRGRRRECVLFLRLDRGRFGDRAPGVVAASCRRPSSAVGWHAAGYVGGQHE